MPTTERFHAKVDSVLETCAAHLFQGCVFVPVEAREPVRSGRQSCSFCRHRIEDSRTELHCRRSVVSSAYQSLRTGEPFFTTCWLGLNTCVVPVAPGGRLRGAITLGAYAFFGDVGDPAFVRANIPTDRAGRSAALDRDLADLCTVSPFQARHAAAFVWDAVMAAGLNDGKDLARRHEHYLLQRRIAEQMHRYCQEQTMPDDAAELLPVVSAALRAGDKAEVLQVFNDYCCRVLLSDASNLERVKAHFHLLASLLARERALLGRCSMEVAVAEQRLSFQQVAQAADNEDACYVMFCRLRAALSDPLALPLGDRLSDRMLAWLGRHFAEPLTLNQAATVLRASTSAIAKALRRETGQSFVTHLHRLRLLEAKDLLATSSLSIYQIAERCGYYDPSHFHRRFRREFAMGPRDFRKMLRRSEDL
jgi:AraC-like DNA-binding protein/ligand-binding sensor protein